MKLSVFPRTTGKKSEPKKNRREGHVPGVLYGIGQPNQNICVSNEELQAILRNMKAGLLATTIFELHEGQKKLKAIIKEVQYHPTSYAVTHIDFAMISDEKPVTVNVPIQAVGVADCPGVKLGGFLRQAIRSIKVKCLPKHIPQEFVVDVRDMNIGQAKTLSDLTIPDNVTPMAKMNEVVMVVAKKA